MKRPFLWFFLGVQAIFIAWIIGGFVATSDSCAGEIGTALEACQAGSAVGSAIGVGIIIALWAVSDFILGVSYLIYRMSGSKERKTLS